VMELVDAPTLADLVRADGPLPVERVAEIGAQIAGALEAAHQAGIVHRDVKPGNVMVGERGVAKLADFGIASLQGDPQLTSTGLVIGSPAYMAPEQARGEERGPPVDFSARGATMFYAVEGEPPFDRGTSIATLAAVVNDPPRAPRRAGPLPPLIPALLQKDPPSRPSGPELRAELSRLAAVPASPPTEVLPVHGPGRTVPMPAGGDGQPRRDGAPADGAAAAAAAAGLAAAGSQAAAPSTPAQPADATPIPASATGVPATRGAPGTGGSPVTPTPTPNDGSDRPATSGEPAVPPRGAPAPATRGDPAPPTGGGPATPAAGVSTHRPSDAPAFEPSQAAPGPAGPPRPLLPPAPVVPRRGTGRSLAVVGLLLVLGLAAVLMAVNLRSNDDGNPTPTRGPTAHGAATTRPSEPTQGAARPAAPETTKAPSTTAAESGLPAGWEAYTNRAGSNRVGVPPGFRARTRKPYNATVGEGREDPK